MLVHHWRPGPLNQEGLWWNCNIFHRGRALQILWRHTHCLELLLKKTLARDPVPQCLHISDPLWLWSLKGLLAQQMQSYLGHSCEKYQSQIHGTFFLHLSCPCLIFLCPALVFFWVQILYPVVVITQLVNLDESLPQCQLVNKLAPLLLWIWTEVFRRCKDCFHQLQIRDTSSNCYPHNSPGM